MVRAFAPFGTLLQQAGACAVGCLPLSVLKERMPEAALAPVLETLPEMKGLLCAAFPYATGQEPPGPFSRYARGGDYHTVLRLRLEPVIAKMETAFPGHHFRYYADASPFPEVWAAARAGLGLLGQNGLLITESAGSYVFLAFLASDLEIASTAGDIRPCRGCGACIRQCPAAALSGDAPREQVCLSALTQRRGTLTEAQQALIRESGSLWGCDRCQLCCPENQQLTAVPLPEFLPLAPIPPEDLTLSDKAFRKKYAGRAFTWRGVAPLRRNAGLLGLLPAEANTETTKEL